MTPILNVGGFVPFSCCDFPGNLSAVVFCQGCVLRCRYCQNPHLREFKSSPGISFEDICRFLLTRRGLLDAVVFSGGEPLFQKGILEAITLVREMGFKVGLHTSGASSKLLEPLLPKLNWIGLDIKALQSDYRCITLEENSGVEAFNSLELLLESGLDYEVRTTFHSLLSTEEKSFQLAEELKSMGVKNYALQIFRGKGCEDAELCGSFAGMSNSTIKRIAELFPNFSLRN